MFAELRRRHPEANIVAVDYDPGASETNQLNRIKLMVATAHKRHQQAAEAVGQPPVGGPPQPARPLVASHPVSPVDVLEDARWAGH